MSIKLQYKAGTCHVYAGRYSAYQLRGNSQVKHEASLDERQSFLYQRAIHGLQAYNEEQIKTMPLKKRKKIVLDHKHSQKVLNMWKQKIVNAKAANLFTTLFPKNPITKVIVDTIDDTSPQYFNNLTFKDLKISRKQVISMLITEKILPSDFYKPKTTKLCN